MVAICAKTMPRLASVARCRSCGRHAVHLFGGGAVAEEHDAEVVLGGLPGGGLAADVGGDPADDDGVDAAFAQWLGEIGAVEGAVAGLVEDEVVGATSRAGCSSAVAVPSV